MSVDCTPSPILIIRYQPMSSIKKVKKVKAAPRTVKVVCVTGTPGTGKTTICNKAMEMLDPSNFEYVNIGDLIKEKKLFAEWDDEMNCSIFDEDAIEAEIKAIVKSASRRKIVGLLLDFHSIGFIPSKLVDQVFVVRADTEVLWDRLKQRGYEDAKIQENVQAEIFMESMNEALDQFDEDIVEERTNNTLDEMKETLKRVMNALGGSPVAKPIRD